MFLRFVARVPRAVGGAAGVRTAFVRGALGQGRLSVRTVSSSRGGFRAGGSFPKIKWGRAAEGNTFLAATVVALGTTGLCLFGSDAFADSAKAGTPQENEGGDAPEIESGFEDRDSHVKLFAGNGNPELAKDIATKLGMTLSKITVGKFLDGETNVKLEESVRGKDCYLIQPTCSPSNDNLMELVLMVSACRRASAKKITAVIPFYGYKLEIGGESVKRKKSVDSTAAIAAADVAKMLEVVGVDHFVTVDLQPPGQGQIQGFFANNTPVDDIEGTLAGVEYFRPIVSKNAVMVSASPTCTKKTRDFQSGLIGSGYRWNDGEMEKMKIKLALFIPEVAVDDNVFVPDVPYPHSLSRDDKERRREQKKRMYGSLDLVGDVKGRDVIIVDDMVDTGSALLRRAKMLKERGALKVYAFATHGVFSENALERIMQSEHLEQVVVTDTIPWRHDKKFLTPRSEGEVPKVVRVSVSGLVAECIRRVHDRQSLKKYTDYQSQNIEERYASQGLA